MNLEILRVHGEEIHQELGREYYGTGSGLKKDAEFQQIYDRYGDLASHEALELVLDSGNSELVGWIVDLRSSRRVAKLDEKKHAWEQSASITVDDARIPYLKLPIEISNSSDRDYRIKLDSARADLGATELNGLLRERFGVEHDEVERLGRGDYVKVVGNLADIDLDDLGGQAATFLCETADVYRDVLSRLISKRLSRGLDDLVRSDAAWAFRADEFDSFFASDGAVEIAHRQMRDMGLDAGQSGRVNFDTAERPGKQPRAFCVRVRVPHEIYLVLRPRGGHADYRTLWHELGHAMHFASVDPEASFEAKWLGDSSVTEGFAMLWDHLTLDRNWLREYAGMPESAARELLFDLAVSELYMIRRYAAKLFYELALHRSDFSDLGECYADSLSTATLFHYPPRDWLLDVDPGFYVARYLRAWQMEAALAQELTNKFDTDWYRNPRAGSFVQHLMSRGQGDPAHKLVLDVTGNNLTFEPLLDRLNSLFA